MHKRAPLQLLPHTPPPSSLPPLQPLSFLFRSNLRGPICQMYRFPIKAQYLYCHHAGDICVCLHACNPGTRTDCREGCVHECVHECAHASVWVHFFAHWFQGVKYARSSCRQESHKGDMNEVKRTIPVTHHIPPAHTASGLPMPGSGHILLIMIEERLWEFIFSHRQHKITQRNHTWATVGMATCAACAVQPPQTCILHR